MAAAHNGHVLIVQWDTDDVPFRDVQKTIESWSEFGLSDDMIDLAIRQAFLIHIGVGNDENNDDFFGDVAGSSSGPR